MKFIIFAGGAGTRLWPLSRQNHPKQFERLIPEGSTIQFAVERVKDFGLENVFISTNRDYLDLVARDVPDISKERIFSEPARRDLAAAVGLTLFRLKKRGISGTVAILWADHFMRRAEEFRSALSKAEEMISENPNRFVFLGEKPRFANNNLGWIKISKEKTDGSFGFHGWKYRPDILLCEKMFLSEEWLWNPGYFVFDLDFVLGLYEKFMPEMYCGLKEMIDDEEKIEKSYAELESLSFDNAILEKLSPEQAAVLKVDLGWSDPGTLYALKEALEPLEKNNCVRGEQVLSIETVDSLICNDEPDKLVAAVGLDGMVVVNTKDVVLVCHKDKVSEIKKLLQELKGRGREDLL